MTQSAKTIAVPVDGGALEGDLAVPDDARGIVLFAHGSGCSRHSPRNQLVARHLEDGGLATLLVDLLTEEEEAAERRTRHLRFDIGLLIDRLSAALDRLAADPATSALPVGCFGASTAQRPHSASPAPAPRPSQPSSRAAGAPIWLEMRCGGSKPLRC